MRGLTTPARASAIALGCAASAGCAYLLLKDDVLAGRWSDSFVMVPLILGIAVVAGHLAAKALRDRSILSACGFAIAFAVASLMTVYSSVSKQATSTDAKTLEAVASNRDRSVVEAALLDAQIRYKQALDQADAARSSGGCGRVCTDWSKRALEVDARVRELKAELKSMDPQKPVAAGAEKMARVIYRLFGLDPVKVKDFILDVEQLAYTLLFEITAISSFGYGLSGNRAPRVAAKARMQPTPDLPEPPGDRRDPAIVSWVEEYTRRHGRAPQIPEVQKAFEGLSRTSAYRYAKSKHGVA